MILAASFIWICCWWCNIIQWYSVSAFHHCNLGGTNQRRLYNNNEDKTMISSSCVVLFAKGSGGGGGQKKKKKNKNKSKRQTKKENLFLRSDGGKGFGIPRATATANAPVSNEEDKGRAIKVEPETQQRQPQRMTSNSVRARKQRMQKWGQRHEENIETTITTFGDGNEAKIENKHNIINNDDDEDEDEEVIQQWIERCRGEFLDFELRKLIPSPKRLVQVSEDPLIFTVDEFLDPALCARVRSNGSGCFNLMYPERLSDTLFDGQESEMDGLLFNVATSREHASATTTTKKKKKKKKNQHDQMHYYPHGLHMDTNNQCLERHVTAILYLNDVPTECGGATVFPIARASPHDPALKASERLLQHRIDHTHSPALLDDPNLQADAALLESRVGSNFGESPHNETAIKIQPKAGRLLVFFSRRNDGTQDPRAWHAGARLLDATNDGNEATTNTTEKRILTLFKQVDYGDGSTTTATTTATTTTTTTTSRSMKNNLDAYLAPQVEEQRLLLQRKARPKTQS